MEKRADQDEAPGQPRLPRRPETKDSLMERGNVQPSAQSLPAATVPLADESAAVSSPVDATVHGPVLDSEPPEITHDQSHEDHEAKGGGGRSRAHAKIHLDADLAGYSSGDGAMSPRGSIEDQKGFELMRTRLRALVSHWSFMTTIYAVIAYDTFLIANDDISQERNPGSSIHHIVLVSDWIILFVFSVEMAIKIIAFGPGKLPDPMKCIPCARWTSETHRPAEKSSYSHETPSAEPVETGEGTGRDSLDRDRGHDDKGPPQFRGYFDCNWNRLDFCIVAATWILVPVQYAMLDDETVGRLVRIVRIGRPLRAFRTFDGTKDVLKTFPRAIPAMGDVLALLLFVLVVYAILGINLYGLEGQFHGRCVVADGHAAGTHGLLLKGNFDDVEPLCSSGDTCPAGFACSCKARLLPPDDTLERPPYAYADPVTGDPGCLMQDAGPDPQCPHYGYECFDNFGLALYTIFTKITMDTWTLSMWWAQDTAGSVVGVVFYMSLLLIVAFNIVNLNVAVMSTAYQDVREQRREINKSKLERSMHDQRSLSNTPAARPWCAARAIMHISDWFERGSGPRTRPLNRYAHAARRFTCYPLVVDECGMHVSMDLVVLAAVRNLEIHFGPVYGDWRLVSGPIEPAIALVSLNEKLQSVGSNQGGGPDGREAGDAETDAWDGEMVGAVVASGSATDDERASLRRAIMRFAKGSGREEIPHEAIPSTPLFDQVVMVGILLNTLTMMTEHFDGRAIQVDVKHVPSDNCCNADCSQSSAVDCPHGFSLKHPHWEEFALITEGFFATFFTLEVAVKLLAAWSARRFLCENWPFNLLDLLIVIASDVIFLIELGASSIFNLTVFRLVRVLRAFRMVSRFQRLRNLVSKAVASFKTILHVLCVLVFWHIIAALLGMQVFSCSVRDEQTCALEAHGECPEACAMRIERHGDVICQYTDEQVCTSAS